MFYGRNWTITKGDILLIYRTTDGLGPARFRSVATSVCIVEEIKRPSDFKTEAEFLKYTNAYSIFNEQDLKDGIGVLKLLL